MEEVTEGKLTPERYRRDGFGSNPAFFGLVAESGREVVGYLLYHYGYDTERAERVMTIIDLYVSQAHRRKGIGASLMNQASSICAESDVAVIVWSVYKPNQAARKFYERQGGKVIDDEDFMCLEVR